MATMPSVATMWDTPNTYALPSVRPKLFSNRACNAHTHSNPIIQTMVNANFGISSGVICKKIQAATRPAATGPKISHISVDFAKF